MTDVAEFQSLKGKQTFDGRNWDTMRGSGGTALPNGNWAVAVAEENLVAVPGILSAYPATYSIGMHELSHTLESKGMTPAQQARIQALFAAHSAKDPADAGDTWTDKYAASNVHEYFAQATTAFFGANKMGGNHNGRAFLQSSDPDLYAFLVDLYDSAHDASGAVPAP